MTVEDEILKLTAEWYSLVGRDIHKDRDCHFYIEKKWSYGQDPVYSVQHDGYIWDGLIDREFTSSKDAHVYLLNRLREMVRAERGVAA